MSIQSAERILTENEAHAERQENGCWRTIWCGLWWGGEFFHESDAWLCAYWCEAQPIEDAEAWVLQNED